MLRRPPLISALSHSYYDSLPLKFKKEPEFKFGHLLAPSGFDIDRKEIKCPYVAGDTIPLQLDSRGKFVEALIVKVFEPFTFSCVMVVRLNQEEGLGEPMVLKLFDRRLSTGLRNYEGIDSWNLGSELQYHKFIHKGGAAGYIADLDSSSSDDDDDTRDEAQNEAFLRYRTRRLYKTELEVYDTLNDVQGKRIPRLLTPLRMPVHPLVLESLSENLSLYAPRDVWQSICEQSMKTIHIMTQRGVLNEDVKARNLIVQVDHERKPRVFMVDFGYCHFRREYKDHQDWWEWKALVDEEGAVGYVMERYLKKGFKYHQSLLYEELDDEFMSDES